MPDHSAQIKMLEDELKNAPLPTPMIGETIVWYPENKTHDGSGVSMARAAIVTGIESPGRLTVLVFAPNNEPRHRKGVWHTTWTGHKRPGNETTKTNGSWDYITGRSPQKDFDAHREHVRAKIARYRETHTPPVPATAGEK